MCEKLERAAALLRREAQILRESNPDSPERRGRGGEWSGNLDAKNDHDELLGAAESVDEVSKQMSEQQTRIAELEHQAAIGRRALEVISRWPDGGSEYGQQKIKAFAKATLVDNQATPEPATVALETLLAEQKARIAELEKSVEWWQGCTKDCGDVINDGIESRQQLRAKVANLEARAAIGQRAVEMLRKHHRYLGESVGEVAAEWCIECDNSGACADDCELAAILRDAEQLTGGEA